MTMTAISHIQGRPCASRSRFRAWMRRFSSHRSPLPPRFSISRLAYPSCEVFTTTELFDVTAARDHFDGTVEAGECRFCAFDARNREHHARNAGRLF